MKTIVLLDTQKLDPQFNLSLENALVKSGYHFKSYTTTNLEDIKERCYNSEVILVNKNTLNGEYFKLLPNLKYVIVVATGYDNVDVVAAQQYGIKVSNIPGYSTPSVAQHAMALLLELTNRIGFVSQQLQNYGKWYGINHKNLELSGLTLGVIGFGRIAQAFIRMALAFDMKVQVHSRRFDYNTNLDVKFVDRDTLFKTSDVISLHCALNTETYQIINKNSLALMKENSFLINVSRGGLINEADLFAALSNKKISGAGLDVLAIEPPDENNPLLKLSNCVITPHNAWVSDAALDRWIDFIISYIDNFKIGNFINLI